MDKITRDILVILLAQQEKFRNEIAELRKEIIEESKSNTNLLRHTARILYSIPHVEDPNEKKKAMDTLFQAFDDYQFHPEVDRSLAKMETNNDTLAAHAAGIIKMLKSMDFGGEEDR
jgi:uncharacterized protein YoxC